MSPCQAGIDRAEKIANAVLYEGYMLYPYRMSAIKNRQRHSFGTLLPQQHEDVALGSERCYNQTQCMAMLTAAAVLCLRLRFLHIMTRSVEAFVLGAGFEQVDSLQAGGDVYWSCEEAVEREVGAEVCLAEVVDNPRTLNFEFPARTNMRELKDGSGEVVGRIRRTQNAVMGRVRVSAERVDTHPVFRLSIEVVNATPYAEGSGRTSALLASLASVHSIMALRGGEFVSLLDPPETLREAAAACRNVGTYPVLVGEPGEHDLVLSSPIILYDYPQVAPESAGDFFDATEMDEMLTLRLVTLTDDEKREAGDADERVRQLMERTETTAREQLRRTHGIIRGMRPIKDDAA